MCALDRHVAVSPAVWTFDPVSRCYLGIRVESCLDFCNEGLVPESLFRHLPCGCREP